MNLHSSPRSTTLKEKLRPPAAAPVPAAIRAPPPAGPPHIHRPALRPRGAAVRRDEERGEREEEQRARGGAAGTTDRHNHKHPPAASGPAVPNGVFFLLRHAPPGHAPRRRQWEGRERRLRTATPLGARRRGQSAAGRGLAGRLP